MEGAAQFWPKELARASSAGYIQAGRGLCGHAAGAGHHQQLLGLDRRGARDRARRPVAGDGGCLRARQAPVGPEKWWFEAHNPRWRRTSNVCWRPRAGACWQADAATVDELKGAGATWRSADVRTDNAAFERYVGAGQERRRLWPGAGYAARRCGCRTGRRSAATARRRRPGGATAAAHQRHAAGQGGRAGARARAPAAAGPAGGAGAGHRHAGRLLVAAQTSIQGEKCLQPSIGKR